MKRKTKISIVMPNYNSSLYFEQTVKSIFNQSFLDWELIIVDDNSNFQTKKILKKYLKRKKIRIFFLKRNRGDGYCRLYGIKKAYSNIIAFIDSDDIWKKNKLKLQYNFMKKYNLSFSYTQYDAFKENGFKKRVFPPNKLNYENFTKNTSIATSSMMIRRKLFNRIKLSHSPNFEDYFLKCQILKKINYAYCLQNNLLDYRIRIRSLSNDKLRNIIWIWIINRKFNKMSFFKSLISVFLISFNSIKKYGLK